MSIALLLDTYANHPLQWIAMQRCLFVAGNIIGRSDTTMALEGSGTSGYSDKVLGLTYELYYKRPRHIWKDEDNGEAYARFKNNFDKWIISLAEGMKRNDAITV